MPLLHVAERTEPNEIFTSGNIRLTGISHSKQAMIPMTYVVLRRQSKKMIVSNRRSANNLTICLFNVNSFKENSDDRTSELISLFKESNAQ